MSLTCSPPHRVCHPHCGARARASKLCVLNPRLFGAVNGYRTRQSQRPWLSRFDIQVGTPRGAWPGIAHKKCSRVPWESTFALDKLSAALLGPLGRLGLGSPLPLLFGQLGRPTVGGMHSIACTPSTAVVDVDRRPASKAFLQKHILHPTPQETKGSGGAVGLFERLRISYV